jgi:hypothetical protein
VGVVYCEDDHCRAATCELWSSPETKVLERLQVFLSSPSATPITLQALLPPHFKLSTSLDPLHHLSSAHAAAMRAGAATSPLPPVPDHLDTEALEGE